MGATYTHNFAAFGELVLNAPFMVEAMRARAEVGEAAARAATPIGPDRDGHFIDHFSVEAGAHGGHKGDRAWAEVVNDDDNAAAKEFGHVAKNGRHVEGLHTLGRAAAAMG